VEKAVEKKDVNITEITFGRVFNLGNYETFRVELKATVGPGQTAEELAKALDKATVRIREDYRSF
jgi:proteasome assembly chaperone (PAC2) family protein